MNWTLSVALIGGTDAQHKLPSPVYTGIYWHIMDGWIYMAMPPKKITLLAQA